MKTFNGFKSNLIWRAFEVSKLLDIKITWESFLNYF